MSFAGGLGWCLNLANPLKNNNSVLTKKLRPKTGKKTDQKK